MQLHTLPKVTKKSDRRLGQGHGSGRGKTSGRGTKGQKARGKIKLSFEGGALPLIKRLPFLRGRNKNKSLKNIPVILNISDLNSLPKDSKVTVEFLAKQKLVDGKEAMKDGIKILGNGELNVVLQVMVPVSGKAKTIIEKAGGTVNLNG